MGKKYQRTNAALYKSPRWKAVRLEILRRDGFKCCLCGSRLHLEVDHKDPLRAGGSEFECTNLWTLCRTCHARKTRREIFGDLPPERLAWKELVLSTR